jgi:hypothetical protein
MVAKIGARQWALTQAGFELLGVEPITAKRRWRDSKWRLRAQVATVEILETID